MLLGSTQDLRAWDTDAVFDLGAWVIALLAESGRKKLTTLVFGTEQERALRSVATAAIELTARDLHPADEEQAEQLALVIGQVFNKPVPEDLLGEHTTMLDALQVGIGGQLAALDDATLTDQHQSSAEVLGVPGTVLAETLITYLVREIITRASRGGPLVPLAAQMNHDVTHLQVQQTHDAVRQIGAAVQEALQRLDARAPAQLSSPPLADTDVALHVEQLLGGLELGEHDEAERRVNRLFLPLFRNQQRAAVEALIHVATTTRDHTTQLLACSLLEAADRLDPMLIKIDDVEGLARSTSFSLRSSAAVVLWQWASSSPGRVPIPLLGRLTQPSTEYWYVHAAARAGAKQLLVARGAARTIFDRMAASHDPDDRDYAAADLLEVARIEPRAVPADLARKLALDQDRTVAIRAAELLRVMEAVEDQDRGNYYGQFGM
jgi:hypothetical protein